MEGSGECLLTDGGSKMKRRKVVEVMTKKDEVENEEKEPSKSEAVQEGYKGRS